jgi:hypothetical protein
MRITKKSLDRQAASLAQLTGRPLFVRRCETEQPLYQLAVRCYHVVTCAAVEVTSYDNISEPFTSREMDAYLMGALWSST